jgi:hypothetical protein
MQKVKNQLTLLDTILSPDNQVLNRINRYGTPIERTKNRTFSNLDKRAILTRRVGIVRA